MGKCRCPVVSVCGRIRFGGLEILHAVSGRNTILGGMELISLAAHGRRGLLEKYGLERNVEALALCLETTGDCATNRRFL
jgi:hypothetical protein